MRHVNIIPLVLALLAGPVLAQDRGVVEDGTTGSATNGSAQLWGQPSGATLVAHTCAANTCTRAAPSNSSSPQEGIRVDSVRSYRVSASLSSGTFSGAGVEQLWVHNIRTGTWFYLSGLDLSFSGAAGLSTFSWPTAVNSFRAAEWRIVPRSVGVTTSAAAPTLTVRIEACLSSGCGTSP